MDEATQVIGTQDIYDPRRMGINNSGLSEEDLTDVLCILHPATPTAYKIVENTAQRSPQFVLSHVSFQDQPTTTAPKSSHVSNEYDDEIDDDDDDRSMLGSQRNIEEAETFIVRRNERPAGAMDIALRMSADLQRPELGFVFGRNPQHCDVILDGDSSRRISNLHFRVFINNQGVLMLEDASTNGTIVDEQVLTGRQDPRRPPAPSARMIVSGSIVQIVSPKPKEIIKFVVRIPNREGFEAQFNRNFQVFMEKFRRASEDADRRMRMAGGPGGLPGYCRTLFDYRRLPPAASGSLRPPVHSVHFGMHWSGGDKYSVVGNIGKGAFATVYQIATKNNGQLFAAKELDKRRCMKNNVLDRKVMNEMSIMQTISHPNIVQYIEYHEVESYLYIIMEFVPGGDLQQYLAARGRLHEPIAKTMSHQVLSALGYLHQNKITHRDIKPDNILLADIRPDTFTIKLSDFGLSKVVADDKETFLKTFCGTLLYCAPEVFPHYDAHVAAKSKKRTRAPTKGQGKQYHSYSQSVDIWSFAAVLWYSLCLSPPFEGVADANGKGMFDRIMATPLDTRVLLKYRVSDDAINLLAEMLNTDPSLRPSPAQCLQHEWFGGKGKAAVAVPDTGLDIIAEEQEAEAPDVGNLSIGEPSQGSQYSINSADMNFFDPPQPKRHKSAVFDRNPDGVPIDSSPEVIFDRMPEAQAQNGESAKTGAKLFGEISQAALGQQAKAGSGIEPSLSYSSEEDNVQGKDNKSGSPSLLGTTSLVKNMKVNSPNHSVTVSANTSTSPRAQSKARDNDTTPKAKPAKKFNRQINMAYPPSLYWDPADPSTHTIEYASKVSGHDFAKHPTIRFPPGVFPTIEPSLPKKKEQEDEVVVMEAAVPETKIEGIKSSLATPSATATTFSFNSDDEILPMAYDDDEEYDPASTPTPTPHLPKPFRSLGTLMSTADSFAKLNLVLNRKSTSWGRAHDCEYVWPDGHDTRIPKRGVIICFFGREINQYADDDERWAMIPDLQPWIMTEKRGGIHVNGIPLPASSPDRQFCGKLYTGDEIDVFVHAGEQPLKLICEFFQGPALQSRPITMPPFSVELLRAPGTETPPPQSSDEDTEVIDVIDTAT